MYLCVRENAAVRWCVCVYSGMPSEHNVWRIIECATVSFSKWMNRINEDKFTELMS